MATWCKREGNYIIVETNYALLDGSFSDICQDLFFETVSQLISFLYLILEEHFDSLHYIIWFVGFYVFQSELWVVASHP
jgi:hypothetical protein